MGSANGYTVPAQVRFVLQWFSEWSEMQKGDFLPVLAEKIIPSGCINGLVSDVDGVSLKEDRPPSIFQCRIKLFKEWADNWSESEKQEVLARIKALDSNFAKKIDEQLQFVTQVVDEVPPEASLQNDTETVVG